MPQKSDLLNAAALLVVSAICIYSVRGPAADAHAHAKETSDINLLPPPEEVVKLSLGYRSALADLLWAQVLVNQGLRTIDRRRYDTVADLLDTINELDPEFRTPYLWADALVTIQVVEARREECERVRAILERGLRNRPLDAELWRTAGQFVGFVGPGTFIKDPEEMATWRRDGARMLARAAELGGDEGYAGWSAVASAGMLSRQGERESAIRLIRRTLAVTEDEELQALLQKQLAALIGEEKLEAYRRRQTELLNLTMSDLPFIRKTMLHVMGPPFDTAYCAGGKPDNDKRCALTWKTWATADDVKIEP